MKFFGSEVRYEEIRLMCEDIRRYFREGAQERCMALQIANENILQWHNNIVDFFKEFGKRKITYGEFHHRKHICYIP